MKGYSSDSRFWNHHECVLLFKLRAARTPFSSIEPVNVDSRVRLKVALTEVTERKPGQWTLKATATLEIEGEEKPAVIAEPRSLCFV